MTIWKQGQFYPELGKKEVELPNQVNPGPSDSLVKIDGFHVLSDKHGNFIEGTSEESYSENELDAIHTYAIIRMVINIYENLLGKHIQWSWQVNDNKEPLQVRIKNNDINARFLKEQKCIELDYYGPYNNWTYNCRSVDIIAHETGHAIIDSLKPNWEKGNTETRGLAEAFCDLAAMFFVLSQKDFCQEVINETKGNLKADSILTLFGVGHGTDSKKNSYIRNALNKNVYEKDHWNQYFYCQVVTGTLYDILLLLVDQEKIDDANILYAIGKSWMVKIISVFLDCDSKNCGIHEFFEIFNARLRISENKLEKCLHERKIILAL